ncbi:MAG: RNA-directed DNA polymerase, partial [Psychrobacter glacincola]
MKINEEMIGKAYMVLKDQAFNESYNMYLKKTVASFEFNTTTVDKNSRSVNSPTSKLNEQDYSKLTNFFKEFATFISKSDFMSSDRFSSLLDSIEVKKLPKSYESEKSESNLSYFTNVKTKSSYSPRSYNYIIKAPIEIHLIDTLWGLLIGKNIEKSLSENVYGNRLTDNSIDFEKKYSLVKSSNHMFKFYYSQYRDWRNGAISTASEISKKDENVAILALDIKSFYYSLDVDIKKIPYGDFSYINEALEKILLKFNDLLSLVNDESITETALPIGFFSSAIIANYTLAHFDDYVVKEVRPSYYGRYVDDLLFVFKNPVIDIDNPTLKFIERYFKGLISLNEDGNYRITSKDSVNRKDFIVQEKKVVLQ